MGSKELENPSYEDCNILEIIDCCEELIQRYGEDSPIGLFTNPYRESIISALDLSMHKLEEYYIYDLWLSSEVLEMLGCVSYCSNKKEEESALEIQELAKLLGKEITK